MNVTTLTSRYRVITQFTSIFKELTLPSSSPIWVLKSPIWPFPWIIQVHILEWGKAKKITPPRSRLLLISRISWRLSWSGWEELGTKFPLFIMYFRDIARHSSATIRASSVFPWQTRMSMSSWDMCLKVSMKETLSASKFGALLKSSIKQDTLFLSMRSAVSSSWTDPCMAPRLLYAARSPLLFPIMLFATLRPCRWWEIPFSNWPRDWWQNPRLW